jgi:hypothetical protein
MFDYSGYDPPPRRKRRGVPWGIILALICLVTVALPAVRQLAPRSTARSAPTPQASNTAAAPTEAARARQLSEGMCIDPTTSTAGSFAQDIRADLASAVASLAPSSQAQMREAQSAVSLWIRQVDTASLSAMPTKYETTVNVPGALGLTAVQPTPSPGDTSFDDAQSKYAAQFAQVSESRNAARRAAAAAAQAVASLPLDDSPRSRSAISACVSGLLVTVPAVGQRTYLLASDLQENEAPQLAGSFDGAPLIIVQACDSGNASYCGGLLTHFLGEMKKLHVGTVTLVRPENAAAALKEWVHGQPVHGTEVTP